MSILLKATALAALLAGLAVSPAVAAPRHRHTHARHEAVRHTPRFARQPSRYAPARGYGSDYAGTGPYGPNSADPYPPSAADDPYNPYAPPGAAIRAMARRNQSAPGVTNELAPDNIATATGGPSGGVPGFSSH